VRVLRRILSTRDLSRAKDPSSIASLSDWVEGQGIQNLPLTSAFWASRRATTEAEEWETVGPLLISPNRQPSSAAAQPVPTMTTRLIFALARFFRSAVSLSRSAAPEPKHTPPKPDKQGPTGSGAAA
jgi:hypothetical protein